MVRRRRFKIVWLGNIEPPPPNIFRMGIQNMVVKH
jgi:hypothetical protein